MDQEGQRQDGRYHDYDSSRDHEVPVLNEEREPAPEVSSRLAPYVHDDEGNNEFGPHEHHAAIIVNGKRPPPNTQGKWKPCPPKRDSRAPWGLGRNWVRDPGAHHPHDIAGHRRTRGCVSQEGKKIQTRSHTIRHEVGRQDGEQRSATKPRDPIRRPPKSIKSVERGGHHGRRL